MNFFVYGTLRKRESNARLLKNAVLIAEQCWTNGLLYDTGYGYPAMKQTNSSRIYGELYSVKENELARLDQLEGYTEGGKNNLYERIEQMVYTDKGGFPAYMYVAGKDHLLKEMVSKGDWKEHCLLSGQNDSVLYFAYGSCMDHERFIKDGFDHYFQKVLGVGVLTNYTLRFAHKSFKDGMGRADIVEEGGTVEGKIYEIPVKTLKEYLYGREGVPMAYRPTFVTIKLDGKMVEALTFVVVNKKPEKAPPARYEEEILRGGNGFLSADYISTLKTHINFLRKFN